MGRSRLRAVACAARVVRNLPLRGDLSAVVGFVGLDVYIGDYVGAEFVAQRGLHPCGYGMAFEHAYAGRHLDVCVDDDAPAVAPCAQAVEALRRVEAGEDFDVVAARYSEAAESTVSIRKGDRDAAYEDTAFELGNEEVSDVIETPEGYYILKCVSTLNREETDSNKVKIVEERRKEVFGREYDSYVQTLTRHMNEEIWQEITLLHNSEITTSDFFEVFARYYKK